MWLIPEWWLLFFSNCTNFRPILHFLLLFSRIQIISISFISPLPLSTLPCDWGCLGLPWPKLKRREMI
jgi:hypothetical protein